MLSAIWGLKLACSCGSIPVEGRRLIPAERCPSGVLCTVRRARWAAAQWRIVRHGKDQSSRVQEEEKAEVDTNFQCTSALAPGGHPQFCTAISIGRLALRFSRGAQVLSGEGLHHHEEHWARRFFCGSQTMPNGVPLLLAWADLDKLPDHTTTIPHGNDELEQAGYIECSRGPLKLPVWHTGGRLCGCQYLTSSGETAELRFVGRYVFALRRDRERRRVLRERDDRRLNGFLSLLPSRVRAVALLDFDSHHHFKLTPRGFELLDRVHSFASLANTQSAPIPGWKRLELEKHAESDSLAKLDGREYPIHGVAQIELLTALKAAEGKPILARKLEKTTLGRRAFLVHRELPAPIRKLIIAPGKGGKGYRMR